MTERLSITRPTEGLAGCVIDGALMLVAGELA